MENKFYTIGQVSEMFNIPASTLRYYDKEGLFPQIERTSGIRKFSEKEVDALRVIECLKKSGMEIRDIKQFMEWCAEGPATYEQRLALFEARERSVLEEIDRLERTLSMIRFKQWYYRQAIADGSEEQVLAMIPDHLPEEIQKDYDDSHS